MAQTPIDDLSVAARNLIGHLGGGVEQPLDLARARRLGDAKRRDTNADLETRGANTSSLKFAYPEDGQHVALDKVASDASKCKTYAASTLTIACTRFLASVYPDACLNGNELLQLIGSTNPDNDLVNAAKFRIPLPKDADVVDDRALYMSARCTQQAFDRWALDRCAAIQFAKPNIGTAVPSNERLGHVVGYSEYTGIPDVTPPCEAFIQYLWADVHPDEAARLAISAEGRRSGFQLLSECSFDAHDRNSFARILVANANEPDLSPLERVQRYRIRDAIRWVAKSTRNADTYTDFTKRVPPVVRSASAAIPSTSPLPPASADPPPLPMPPISVVALSSSQPAPVAAPSASQPPTPSQPVPAAAPSANPPPTPGRSVPVTAPPVVAKRSGSRKQALPATGREAITSWLKPTTRANAPTLPASSAPATVPSPALDAPPASPAPAPVPSQASAAPSASSASAPVPSSVNVPPTAPASAALSLALPARASAFGTTLTHLPDLAELLRNLGQPPGASNTNPGRGQPFGLSAPSRSASAPSKRTKLTKAQATEAQRITATINRLVNTADANLRDPNAFSKYLRSLPPSRLTFRGFLVSFLDKYSTALFDAERGGNVGQVFDECLKTFTHEDRPTRRFPVILRRAIVAQNLEAIQDIPKASDIFENLGMILENPAYDLLRARTWTVSESAGPPEESDSGMEEEEEEESEQDRASETLVQPSILGFLSASKNSRATDAPARGRRRKQRTSSKDEEDGPVPRQQRRRQKKRTSPKHAVEEEKDEEDAAEEEEDAVEEENSPALGKQEKKRGNPIRRKQRGRRKKREDILRFIDNAAEDDDKVSEDENEDEDEDSTLDGFIVWGEELPAEDRSPRASTKTKTPEEKKRTQKRRDRELRHLREMGGEIIPESRRSNGKKAVTKVVPQEKRLRGVVKSGAEPDAKSAVTKVALREKKPTRRRRTIESDAELDAIDDDVIEEDAVGAIEEEQTAEEDAVEEEQTAEEDAVEEEQTAEEDAVEEEDDGDDQAEENEDQEAAGPNNDPLVRIRRFISTELATTRIAVTPQNRRSINNTRLARLSNEAIVVHELHQIHTANEDALYVDVLSEFWQGLPVRINRYRHDCDDGRETPLDFLNVRRVHALQDLLADGEIPSFYFFMEGELRYEPNDTRHYLTPAAIDQTPPSNARLDSGHPLDYGPYMAPQRAMRDADAGAAPRDEDDDGDDDPPDRFGLEMPDGNHWLLVACRVLAVCSTYQEMAITLERQERKRSADELRRIYAALAGFAASGDVHEPAGSGIEGDPLLRAIEALSSHCAIQISPQRRLRLAHSIIDIISGPLGDEVQDVRDRIDNAVTATAVAVQRRALRLATKTVWTFNDVQLVQRVGTLTAQDIVSRMMGGVRPTQVPPLIDRRVTPSLASASGILLSAISGDARRTHAGKGLRTLVDQCTRLARVPDIIDERIHQIGEMFAGGITTRHRKGSPEFVAGVRGLQESLSALVTRDRQNTGLVKVLREVAQTVSTRCRATVSVWQREMEAMREAHHAADGQVRALLQRLADELAAIQGVEIGVSADRVRRVMEEAQRALEGLPDNPDIEDVVPIDAPIRIPGVGELSPHEAERFEATLEHVTQASVADAARLAAARAAVIHDKKEAKATVKAALRTQKTLRSNNARLIGFIRSVKYVLEGLSPVDALSGAVAPYTLATTQEMHMQMYVTQKANDMCALDLGILAETFENGMNLTVFELLGNDYEDNKDLPVLWFDQDQLVDEDTTVLQVITEGNADTNPRTVRDIVIGLRDG